MASSDLNFRFLFVKVKKIMYLERESQDEYDGR